MSEQNNFMVRVGDANNPVRLSFANIYKPKADDEGKNPKYGTSCIFPEDHPCIADLKAAIVAAAKAKWPAKYKDVLKALKAANKICLKDGAIKADQDGYEGNMFISASNKAKVKIFNADAERVTEEGEGNPYGGCNALVTVDVWAQDHAKFGKRINASLRGVQFHSDNDRFGGAQVAADDEFAPMAAGADDDMPDDDDLV